MLAVSGRGLGAEGRLARASWISGTPSGLLAALWPENGCRSSNSTSACRSTTATRLIREMDPAARRSMIVARWVAGHARREKTPAESCRGKRSAFPTFPPSRRIGGCFKSGVGIGKDVRNRVVTISRNLTLRWLEWDSDADVLSLQCPNVLKRFHQSAQSHFVTFSCYHRRPLFQADKSKATFEIALERIRRKSELRVSRLRRHAGTHPPITQRARKGTIRRRTEVPKTRESPGGCLGTQSISGKSATTTSTCATRISSQRSCTTFTAIPVRRGLRKRPEDREWSSFRHYATGMKAV